MTTSRITATRDGQVLVRFGQHEVPVPDSLAQILRADLIQDRRSHAGTGSPITSPWLFPAACPDSPSPRPGSASACAPPESGPCPDAGPLSSTSLPSCPPPSSLTA